MDRATLMIVSLVFMVAVVGWLTTADFRPVQPITGNVVQQDCSSCSGSPVCAVKEGKAKNYDSSCAAHCAGARVLADSICERIPRND